MMCSAADAALHIFLILARFVMAIYAGFVC